MTTEPNVPGYHALVLIGHGGLGDVYRGLRHTDAAPVAIKILRQVTDESVAWHRTRRELAALTELAGHPNVVRPIELLELESGPALVMEYAPGGSVADLVSRRRRPLSIDEALFVGRQTASALAAAHAAGIVHRDVKPHNLLIDADGQVKLCDFGIAALAFDDDYRTRTNAVSMRYASPEDLEQDLDVGPATDVYSLGATLLALLGEGPLTLKDRLTPWVPPDVTDPRRRAVLALVATCLDPSPGDRPEATEVVDLIDNLVNDAPDAALVDRLDVLPRVIDEVPLFDDTGTIERESLHALPEQTPDPDTVEPDPVEPDPVEPDPVQPEHETASRAGWKLGVGVGAAIGVVVVAGAWLALAIGGSSDSDTVSTTVTPASPVASVGPTVSARPAGLADLEQADWSAGEIGDCLVQVAASDALTVVDCEQPHDLQRFAAGELPVGNGSDDEIAITEACRLAFPGYVGGDVMTSQLEIARTWNAQRRAYECYVGIPTQRIQGDARTSAW